jgi:hypothetical protein
MDNSINKSNTQNNRIELKTQICSKNINDTPNDPPTLSQISENIWKNAPGIQALFIVNSTGKILYSKFSKYFDDLYSDQAEKIISSSCSLFSLATKVNSMKISIGVFEKFTSMTSQIGEQFLVMIVPNNTGVGASIQFAQSLSI